MIGGRILDPGALAAVLNGTFVMTSWLAVARDAGLVFVVPDLVRAEVAGLRRHQGGLLQLVDEHPNIVIEALRDTDATAIEQLMAERGVWDATAGAVVHAARRRGWQILTGDPGRLTRIDPGADLDAL